MACSQRYLIILSYLISVNLLTQHSQQGWSVCTFGGDPELEVLVEKEGLCASAMGDWSKSSENVQILYPCKYRTLGIFLCLCEHLNFKVHHTRLSSSRLPVKYNDVLALQDSPWSNLVLSGHQDSHGIATYVSTSQLCGWIQASVAHGWPRSAALSLDQKKRLVMAARCRLPWIRGQSLKTLTFCPSFAWKWTKGFQLSFQLQFRDFTLWPHQELCPGHRCGSAFRPPLYTYAQCLPWSASFGLSWIRHCTADNVLWVIDGCRTLAASLRKLK